MRLAALLPKPLAEHIRAILPRTSIVFVDTWNELSAVLRTAVFAGALINPETDGENTAAALRVVGEHPRTHIFAYVEPTATSLRAVFQLSKHGLEDVFVHPVKARDIRFLNAMEKLDGDRMASGVLAALESKLGMLPPPVSAAVIDLFHRPYRYHDVSDLASEGGVPVRCLYRALSRAEFGTPRRLITVAKVIHGYSYIHGSAATIGEVSNKLGYADPEVFSNHVRNHLGAPPSSLRPLGNSDELLLRLIEGLYKPSVLQRHFKLNRARESRA